MSLFQSVFFGVIQGLTEFLPISSSGHLVLIPWFFGWKDPGLTFNVALHLGTLLAVLLYFRSDILALVKVFLGISNQERGFQRRHSWLIIGATVPGVLAGLLLEDFADTIFRNPLLVALMLFLIGIVLFLVDRAVSSQGKISNLKWQGALKIGLAQTLAIIPGTSRSGVTIIAGLGVGLSRSEAARFSFLLSIPLIFGAVMLKFLDFFSAGISWEELLGISSAFISGLLAIDLMMKLSQKIGYGGFFFYRLTLAVIIIVAYFIN